MSFGFSIGDFVAVGNLALQLYCSYKEAPSKFQAVCRELLSLYSALEEIQLDLNDASSIISRAGKEKIRKLNELVTRCEEELRELDGIRKKYSKMDEGRKVLLWQRIKLGQEDIGNIRNKLSVHLQGIALYLTSFDRASLSRIEQKLETLLQLEPKIDQYFAELKRNRTSETNVLLAPDSLRKPESEISVFQEEIENIMTALEEAGTSKDDLRSNQNFITTVVIWRSSCSSTSLVIPERKPESSRPGSSWSRNKDERNTQAFTSQNSNYGTSAIDIDSIESPSSSGHDSLSALPKSRQESPGPANPLRATIDLYVPDDRHPLRGVWVGDYGVHGKELIWFHQPDDGNRLEAWKLTGDINIPCGQVAFRVPDLGNLKRPRLFRSSQELPASWHIADPNFENATWCDSTFKWDHLKTAILQSTGRKVIYTRFTPSSRPAGLYTRSPKHLFTADPHQPLRGVWAGDYHNDQQLVWFSYSENGGLIAQKLTGTGGLGGIPAGEYTLRVPDLRDSKGLSKRWPESKTYAASFRNGFGWKNCTFTIISTDCIEASNVVFKRLDQVNGDCFLRGISA